ncbi:ribitol-5-phosphate transferase FKTN-like isoform X2 [Lineus longissimus]|uniref:ribitol-5-phosphate transferase FKTN-like isoform X2 n=1 Tax=Lineus longissimus TaxID=88925 RepID=UPI002B4DE394
MYPHLSIVEISHDPSEVSEALAVQSYINIQHFARICASRSMVVTLIEPSILTRIVNKENKAAKCRYLCIKETVTTFSIMGNNLHEAALVEEMEKEKFTVIPVLHKDPRHLSLLTGKAEKISTHFIFLRNFHVIHLVVFYERQGGFLWHGPVRFKMQSRNVIERLKFDAKLLRFGHYPGAYDTFDTAEVTIDSVTFRAPRYPKKFLDQIPHARFIECNYTRAQEFYRLHSKDNGEEAEAFREAAAGVVRRGKAYLDSIGVRFWMSSGTCLGWFRQCDIIPYSKDVDFGIWIKDYNEKLMPTFEENSMPIKHVFGKVADSFELSFQSDDVKLDMFFFYEEEEYMWNGGTQAKTGKKFKYFFPKFTLCWTSFLDLKIRIPCETLSYIEANYGTNWFTPVTEWDWKQSPPNVRENGVWPQDEWDEVIQLL